MCDRLQTVDNELENVSCNSDDILIPVELQSHLSSCLDYVSCQLAACRDCHEEADQQLTKLRCPSGTKPQGLF